MGSTSSYSERHISSAPGLETGSQIERYERVYDDGRRELWERRTSLYSAYLSYDSDRFIEKRAPARSSSTTSTIPNDVYVTARTTGTGNATGDGWERRSVMFHSHTYENSKPPPRKAELVNNRAARRARAAQVRRASR